MLASSKLLSVLLAGCLVTLLGSTSSGCGADEAPLTASGGTRADGSKSPTKGDGGTVPRQDSCAAIREDAPLVSGAVDVIWLIDTSASMVDELAQVQANIAIFMQQFQGSSADARLVVITALDPAAGTPLASDSEHYRFIEATVDSKALFTTALLNYPAYQDFLRPNAPTQFVMVTDDDDAMPPDLFRQQMEAQLGHSFTQHAVASESVNGEPCQSAAAKANPICAFPIPVVCAAAAVGAAYYALADLTEGEQISICAEDWSDVFGRLKSAVIEAAPLPCEYPLAEVEADQLNPKQVQVVYTPADGGDQELPKASSQQKCGKAEGWYYDDEDKPTQIILCPSACELVQGGGSMDIGFGCTPTVI